MAFFVNGTRVETGGDQKDSCRVATTGNIALTGLQTIDGISLVADDRVLVKNQTLSQNNGIYAVSISTWSRTSDADTDDEVTAGMLVQVEEGATNAETLWALSTDGTIVVGTTPITFTRIAPTGAGVLAGAGLEDDGFGLLRIASTAAGDGLGGGSGVPLDVNVDAATIEIVADTLQVKDAGIDEDKLAASVAGVGLSGGAGTPLAVNTDGSTLEITADILNVKASGITETQLSASVAGNGLSGGAGTPLAVNVDGATLEIFTDALRVKAAGVTETQLSTSVAGAGLAGGGGTALSVNAGDGIQIVADAVAVTADVERTTNKGAASGYAPLDAGSKLPLTNLPPHASTHKGDGTDPVASATTLVSGLMSAADKTKLDGIEAGATADQIASEVPFTPAGGISATNVQTALAEVDSEAEKLVNKNAASGYAGLDGSARIAKAQGHSRTIYSDQANSYTVGMRQSFEASPVTPGLQIIGTPADPTTLLNGDLFINTTSDDLKFRTGGVTRIIERTDRKNVASGYAGLDASTKLSGAQQTYGLIVNTAAEGDKVIRKDGSVAFTADQSMGAFKLTNLAAPIAASDAARKTDVDSAISGLDVKEMVKAATTVDITLSGAQTIDGVSIVASDRVLVKNQTLGENNGIYVAAAGAWTRATDADTATEIEGMFAFVAQGTINANSGWYLITDAIILGTTVLVYTQFTGAGSLVAGDGIDITGSTISVDVSDIAGAGLENDGSNNLRISTAAAGVGLSGGGGAALDVNVDGSTLEIPVDTLQVKAAGITGTHLNTSVAGTGLSGGGGSALSVNVDGSTLEIPVDTLQVKAAGITGTHLNTSVAGTGLAGGGGSALSVNVDGSTLEIPVDTLQVKAAGITETHLNTSVAGNGLSGGGGTALAVNVSDGIEISADALRLSTAAAGAGLTGGGGVALAVGDVNKGVQVNADDVQVDASEVAHNGLQQRAGAGNEHQMQVKSDATGGANLSRSIDVNTNGVAVKIDTTTIAEGASSRLKVTDAVREEILIWNVSGNIATGLAFDGGRIARLGGTIVAVTMFLEDRGGAGGGGITRVDINKHTPAGAITTQQNGTAGTTIYTTQANRPTLTGGGTTTDNAVIQATAPDVLSFAAGDFFTMDIDDRPTGPNSNGLAVQLHVQYT